MFLSRSKKDISIFQMKKAPNLLLCMIPKCLSCYAGDAKSRVQYVFTEKILSAYKLFKRTGYTWYIIYHFYTREATFVTSPVCFPVQQFPSEKWSLNGKTLLHGSKFFPFRVDPFYKDSINNFDKVASLDMYRFPLTLLHRITALHP